MEKTYKSEAKNYEFSLSLLTNRIVFNDTLKMMPRWVFVISWSRKIRFQREIMNNYCTAVWGAVAPFWAPFLIQIYNFFPSNDKLKSKLFRSFLCARHSKIYLFRSWLSEENLLSFFSITFCALTIWWWILCCLLAVTTVFEWWIDDLKQTKRRWFIATCCAWTKSRVVEWFLLATEKRIFKEFYRDTGCLKCALSKGIAYYRQVTFFINLNFKNSL